ncbi:MAG: oligosaccharide flippase family protein [Clostridia bacterium]|nr:oligosaccharide flippase family protein [Clostridia bacterium]
MKNTRRLLINTLILTATAFLMRTIGVSFNIYLTNKIGASGIGLFSLVTTVYTMAVTFSTAGLKLASTRLVVEDNGRGLGNSAKIMRMCILYGLFVGIAMACVLAAGANIIAEYWLNDMRTVSALRILALSLPFVAMSSALSGYFTAERTISKYAVVQVIEQITKISVVVLTLSSQLSKGLEFACDAIVAGMTASEAVSFSCSFILFKLTKKERRLPVREQKADVKEMLRIALPDAAGSCARSVLLTIEHLLIPVGFRKSGQSSDSAMAVYGTIHGMALPIILYPAAILTSLSSMLVPEFAECSAQNNKERIESMAARVIKITMLFSLGTAGVMYVFADELSMCIYNNLDSAMYLRVLAPLLPIMYMDTTVDGILKGLDQQVYSMRYNIIDSALCVVLVYILIPKYSVTGYIVILFVSELINFYLSLRRLIKVCKLDIDLINGLLKPAICILASFFLVRVIASGAIDGKLILTAVITFVCAVYILLLTLTGSVSGSDMRWFKSIFSKH